jgi:murein DD-endopeptidase MepM/ murein hydrolase activator NlpD
MRKSLLLSALIFTSFCSVFALAVKQGDVAIIDVPANCNETQIIAEKLGTFPVLTFQNKKVVVIPVDLRSAIGMFQINTCKNSFADSAITVIAIEKEKEDFVIPQEQGGNTTANATKVKTTIANDGLVFLKAWTNKKQLWTEKFSWPIKNYHITDTYGYERDSAGVNIAHKGTDFRADVGTNVFSMNRGVVRYIGTLPSFGKTIIIDHGKGVQSVYLHLSKILVSQGVLVQKDQLIAKSGNTGFVTGPHLHVTIRVGGMSINPESFMKAFGQEQ